MTADLYLSAADLATLLRVPKGTIYRWASEDQWPRTKGRPVRYLASEAEHSQETRALR